ncbi:MAG TPA: T9SS type A sorting domain-containing protein [Phaeodactylibacter sp.]|nr:T9SS type A sorting domain-containing protein [Phaeodactylibacter sp.]
MELQFERFYRCTFNTRDMKYFFTLLASALSLSLMAQITLTTENFPQAGDTLFLAVDNAPTVTLTGPGGPYEWDFTTLQAPFTTEVVYRPASEGSAYDQLPDADMVVTLPAGGEAYYSVENDELLNIALNGAAPGGLGFDLLMRLDPPLVERKAPVQFGFSLIQESSVSSAVSSEALPQEILDQLPITPDSLRLRMTDQRTEFADAYGTMDIPGGSFDVLRIKRFEIREFHVDAYLSFTGWTEITDLLGGGSNLEPDSTLQYIFLSNEAKEPIAEVTADPVTEEVQSVTFKSIATGPVPTTIVPVGSPLVLAYPNPAIFDVRFEFINLKPGVYHLEIYNLLGVKIRDEEYRIKSGNQVEKMDVSDLRKGTYLYSLRGPDGKAITTKRLIIIRP